MKPEEPQEHLREILENLRVPERLDTHPWVNYLFVREATSEDPSLAAKNRGSQLVGAVKRIFSSMMPTTPPKRGKRLDTRWGEFGLLAAQYFAPFVFGLPAPQSMREAWGKIDLAILWFVFEKTPENLAEADISRYKLVRDEPETAPNSTISDWHRKGISHLNELILERENHLSRVLSQSSNLPQSTIPNDTAVPAKSLPTQPALSMKHQKWLFIAGLAWTTAGGILAGRGLSYLVQHGQYLGWRLAGGLVFGLVFYVLLFAKISRKHIKRIHGLNIPYPCAFSFFNLRGYLMMAIMITGGIMLRRFDVINKEWLYNFYVTMGVPLLVSASRFFYYWATNKEIV